MRDIDLSLIKENLKLAREQRLRQLQSFVELAEEMRKTGKKLREQKCVDEASYDKT